MRSETFYVMENLWTNIKQCCLRFYSYHDIILQLTIVFRLWELFWGLCVVQLSIPWCVVETFVFFFSSLPHIFALNFAKKSMIKLKVPKIEEKVVFSTNRRSFYLSVHTNWVREKLHYSYRYIAHHSLRLRLCTLRTTQQNQFSYFPKIPPTNKEL